jgi:hypothetical protein
MRERSIQSRPFLRPERTGREEAKTTVKEFWAPLATDQIITRKADGEQTFLKTRQVWQFISHMR